MLPDAQEGLEHQQRPQRPAVVAPPGHMGIDQMLEVGAVEEAGASQFAFVIELLLAGFWVVFLVRRYRA